MIDPAFMTDLVNSTLNALPKPDYEAIAGEIELWQKAFPSPAPPPAGQIQMTSPREKKRRAIAALRRLRVIVPNTTFEYDEYMDELRFECWGGTLDVQAALMWSAEQIDEYISDRYWDE